MVVLKGLLAFNPQVKLILMSATFDSSLFASYFPLAATVDGRQANTDTPALRFAFTLPCFAWLTVACSGHVLHIPERAGKTGVIAAPVKHVGGMCHPVKSKKQTRL